MDIDELIEKDAELKKEMDKGRADAEESARKKKYDTSGQNGSV